MHVVAMCAFVYIYTCTNAYDCMCAGAVWHVYDEHGTLTGYWTLYTVVNILIPILYHMINVQAYL